MAVWRPPAVPAVRAGAGKPAPAWPTAWPAAGCSRRSRAGAIRASPTGNRARAADPDPRARQVGGLPAASYSSGGDARDLVVGHAAADLDARPVGPEPFPALAAEDADAGEGEQGRGMQERGLADAAVAPAQGAVAGLDRGRDMP